VTLLLIASLLAMFAAAAGLVRESRRGDSNSRPLHYEGSQGPGRGSRRGHDGHKVPAIARSAAKLPRRGCPRLATPMYPCCTWLSDNDLALSPYGTRQRGQQRHGSLSFGAGRSHRLGEDDCIHAKARAAYSVRDCFDVTIVHRQCTSNAIRSGQARRASAFRPQATASSAWTDVPACQQTRSAGRVRNRPSRAFRCARKVCRDAAEHPDISWVGLGLAIGSVISSRLPAAAVARRVEAAAREAGRWPGPANMRRPAR
jgi:hypothetical protein